MSRSRRHLKERQLLSMAAVQGGGIDEILAKLKPKPSSKPIDASTLKIPRKYCQRFDLALIDEGYADDHDMCPTCRKETNASTLVNEPAEAESDRNGSTTHGYSPYHHTDSFHRKLSCPSSIGVRSFLRQSARQPAYENASIK